MKPILESSAFELAEQIRSGLRTSEEVVRAHIKQIELWNPKLNALIEDRFQEAILEARACDQKRAKKNGALKLPPLFGVPFTTKEMISVRGFRHTLGSIHRKDDRLTFDATVVTRLKQAGAILLGTTNVPELGFWFECENPVYGRTNNPYDLGRTPGGSSGGEAAIIGSGGSPFGLGSDIGGSIRIPAAFCGIFGHKPTRRLIPITGHFPVYPENASTWKGDDYPMTVVGPLTRIAKDLYPLMQILIGPDGHDQEIKADFKLKERVTDWTGKTVWMLPNPRIKGVATTEKELREAVKTAARYFEAMGANLKEMRDDTFKESVLLWFASMSRSKIRSFTDILAGGSVGISYAKELFKIGIRRGRYTLPSLAASALEVMARRHEQKLSSKREASFAQLDRLTKKLNELLDENSILILPIHPRVAPRHGTPLLRPLDFLVTAIFNSLDLPATAVVMGLDESLPLSVQIVAGQFQDHLTISAAEALEAAFGGHTPPAKPANL